MLESWETLQLLVKVLKSPGCRKVPVIVKSADDVVLSATNFVSERLCPVFQVSNVTGDNLDLLKMFLNLLTTRNPTHEDAPAEFQIDETYSVPGVGTVVSGTALRGTINVNDTLLLGPDLIGHFHPIAIKSIHRKRMPVQQVRGGQTASFSLKKIKRSQIRKGMVLISPALNPVACWEFEGEILVLHHPTTISTRYQAMVHCGSIRQTASIISMSQDCLRTGDKAGVNFKFIKHPEYLTAGQRLVFREGRTKAVGTITKLIPLTFATGGHGQGSKVKPIKNAPKNSQGSGAGATAAQNNENNFPESAATPLQVQNPPGTNPKRHRGKRGGRGRGESNGNSHNAEDGIAHIPESTTENGTGPESTTAPATKPLAEANNTNKT